jgi:hypothetical protein
VFCAAPIHTGATWLTYAARLPTFNGNSIPNTNLPFGGSLISYGLDRANGLMTGHNWIRGRDVTCKKLMIGAA